MNLSRLFIILNCVFFPLFLKAAASASVTQPDGVAISVHWSGIQKISADTNAAQFMKIWHLPETVALVNQTLDKLSRWPGGGTTNTASQALRPLLDDLVSSEFYFEVFTSTNSQPSTFNSQLLLAVRLPSARETLWQTNLATAFTALAGQKPVANKTGWHLAANRYGQVELTRSGEWTVLGIGPEVCDTLPIFSGSLASQPVGAPQNVWLEADFNLSSLDAAWIESWGPGAKLNVHPLLSAINNLHLTVSGDHGQIATQGNLKLAEPWDASLPGWNIPTNLIHGPLIDFTAVRGIGPWLSGLAAWQKNRLVPAPDQAFLWALDGVPFKTYFMVPLPDASNQLVRLSSRLVEQGNPWLATNALGSFHWDGGQSALVWNGALMINPYLMAGSAGGMDYLLGGLYPITLTGGTSLPANIAHILLNTPDLVYYQTEQTATRVDADLFISQLFRVVFHRAQLPPAAASTQWLKQIQPQLGTCETSLRRTAKQELTLRRQSSMGLSALELHLLADWLESPAFPCGLHTFRAPPDQN